jgi:hypothetical protein
LSPRRQTTPPELVSVAAAAGFRTIGIRLTATPSVGVPPYDILSEGPGEGVLPLAELVAVLPANVPLAIEAPCRVTSELPAVERAKRVSGALRSGRSRGLTRNSAGARAVRIYIGRW